jgi:hypothetical protein
MTTGEVTDTHPESAAVSETLTPDAGAADGTPALSSWTVIDVGKPGENVTDDWVMFSSPRLVTFDEAVAKEGCRTETTALPRPSPRTVALTEN